MLLWTEKYRPRRISDVVGNKAAVQAFLDWMKSWESGRPSKKAALLYGPAGVGKTSTVYAYASERNLDVVEVNASDYRTREKIAGIVGSASQFATLSGLKNRIILVDEVDGIDSRADSGAIPALLKVISETRIPVVLVANDPWDQRLAPLRDRCEMIKFTRIHKASLASHLSKIARSEKLEISDNTLREIAERSGGDLRSAINDLQILAMSLGGLTASSDTLGERDRERDIFTAMAKVFNARDVGSALSALDGLDVEPADFFTWVLDNLPDQVREPKDLSKALDRLSRADIHLQRVSKMQRWNLLKYATALMTAGVSTVRMDRGPAGGRLSFPTKIRFMTQTRGERERLTSISGKIARKCHLSARKAQTEMLPYIGFIIGQSRTTGKEMAEFLGLDADEVKFLSVKYGSPQRKAPKSSAL
ncbi:MAG: replication factor C large subunit [Nitrososphaerota archaeon]